MTPRRDWDLLYLEAPRIVRTISPEHQAERERCAQACRDHLSPNHPPVDYFLYHF